MLISLAMGNNLHFTVDTRPMAKEIGTMTRHVEGVSTAVVAMKTAVIAAEKEGADHICEKIDSGFYSLMASQISQKIAALSSKVEAKLIEMGQQTQALNSIRSKMERDYHMIAARYNKVFNSIDASLKSQILEIEKPTIELVKTDSNLLGNRLQRYLATVSINQLESVLIAQIIAASKTKANSQKAIEAIHKYVKDSEIQKVQSEAVMSNVCIDKSIEVSLPIIVMEASSSLGPEVVNRYVAKSDIPAINAAIDSATNQESYDLIKNGTWQTINESEASIIFSELQQIVDESELSDVLKKRIMELVSVNDIKQLIV